MITYASAALTVLLSLGGADVAGLPLAKDGQTSYQIVKPANPSAVDEYAANELAVYLEQITGAQISGGRGGRHDEGQTVDLRRTERPGAAASGARSAELDEGPGARRLQQRPGHPAVRTAYVSLKFDGPTYGSKPNEPLLAPADRVHYRGLAESDLVLVDRIILVKKM